MPPLTEENNQVLTPGDAVLFRFEIKQLLVKTNSYIAYRGIDHKKTMEVTIFQMRKDQASTTSKHLKQLGVKRSCQFVYLDDYYVVTPDQVKLF